MGEQQTKSVGRGFESLSVSFIFFRKDELMTLPEIRRFLEDHVMDMQLPPVNVLAWKHEFSYVSYYRWAVMEYKIFILNYMTDREYADISTLIDWTENFIAMMEDFTDLSPKANFSFFVAVDVGRNILDILQSMN